MRVKLWDKERKEYMDIEGVTFIHIKAMDYRIHLRDTEIKYPAERYDLDFIHP